MATVDSAHPAVGAVPAVSRDDGQEVQWATARSAGQAAVNLSEKVWQAWPNLAPHLLRLRSQLAYAPACALQALEEKERRLVE